MGCYRKIKLPEKNTVLTLPRLMKQRRKEFGSGALRLLVHLVVTGLDFDSRSL